MEPSASDFKKRREELLLTQEDVSAALGVSVRTVANWDAGHGPSKSKAIEVSRYFQKVSEERMKLGSSTKDEVIEVDRSFIIEVLLRTKLRQDAKILSILEKRDLKEVQAEINSDNLQVMSDLLRWWDQKGKGSFVPVFPSEL
jgi:predicted transcriptional regulator